ncbi:MAG: hypothetical protein AAF690_03415 [Acidobacteriota bacterium]
MKGKRRRTSGRCAAELLVLWICCAAASAAQAPVDGRVGSGRPDPASGFALAASLAISSAPPVPCNETYLRAATRDDSCNYLQVNESYFAVYTARSGTESGTGEEVEELVTSLDPRFELYYSSRYQPAGPNASEPPGWGRGAFSTPNATGAPGDLHVFFRVGLGPKIEKILDSLVAERTKEWYFSPVFKQGVRNAYRDELFTHHEVFVPRIRVSNDTERPTLEELQASIGAGDRVEYRRLPSRRRFFIYPEGRDAFDNLQFERSLDEEWESFPGFFFNDTYPFFLPGDRASGGVSGPTGAGATAVPLSDFALLVFATALGLAAAFWLRRR